MDGSTNVSSENNTGQYLLDECSATRNRNVVGSNPSSGSKTAGQDVCLVLPLALLASLIIPHAGTWPRGGPPG
jgi:hypothetical protein